MTGLSPELLEVLACPACGGDLQPGAAGVRCGACGAGFPAEGGIPDLRPELDDRTRAVRDFYSAAPFPGYAPRESHAALRARAGRSEFARLLDAAIAPDATVLDLGCGTGQMSLFLATGGRRVIGADLTRASLEVAAAAAARMGIARACFVETDLRAPGLRPGAFDVVHCSGVLHHTPDPRAAFAAVARLVRPGGIAVVGVYHAWARWPHRARRAIARLTGHRWIPLDPVLRDRASEPARRIAWLQDQYHHPEEHRHTLREVRGWLAEHGIEYLRSYPSTVLGDSPPRGGLFAPAGDEWALERVLLQLGWCWSLGKEGGLFVVIGRARPPARGVRDGAAPPRARGGGPRGPGATASSGPGPGT